MANTYDLGDSIRLEAMFRVTGSLVDPVIVELEVRDPSGNIDSFTLAGAGVTRRMLGTFYRDVFLNESGQWWYRYFGSGTVLAADEKYLIVDRPVI
ncbi:hypothetical protein KA005_02555 [bacterium]|nr:hypothetical protein [bacterium]